MVGEMLEFILNLVMQNVNLNNKEYLINVVKTNFLIEVEG